MGMLYEFTEEDRAIVNPPPVLRKIDGLMTGNGFAKLQENTVDLYLAKCDGNEELIKILTAERKAICDDNGNYVYGEINKGGMNDAPDT